MSKPLKVNIVVDTSSQGQNWRQHVLFFRATFPDHLLDEPVIFVDARLEKQRPNLKFVECSDYGTNNTTEYVGVKPTETNKIRTFYFVVGDGQTSESPPKFYLNASKRILDAEFWICPLEVDILLRREFAKSNGVLSRFQMTNDTDAKEPYLKFNVAYDLGMSCAISAKFYPRNDSDIMIKRGSAIIPNPNTDPKANPSDPPLPIIQYDPQHLWIVQSAAKMIPERPTDLQLDKVRNVEFDSMPSYVYANCNSSAVGAAGKNAESRSGYDYSFDRASGIHLCRAFHYRYNREDQYVNNKPPVSSETGGYLRTYCNWLRANDIDGLCWRYDGLRCKTGNCGFRDNNDASTAASPPNLKLPQLTFNPAANPTLLTIYDDWAAGYDVNGVLVRPEDRSVAFSCGSEPLLEAPIPHRGEELGGFDITGGGTSGSTPDYRYWPNDEDLGCIPNITNPHAVHIWSDGGNNDIVGNMAELFISFTDQEWLVPPPPTRSSLATVVVGLLAIAAGVVILVTIGWYIYYNLIHLSPLTSGTNDAGVLLNND